MTKRVLALSWLLLALSALPSPFLTDLAFVTGGDLSNDGSGSFAPTFDTSGCTFGALAAASFPTGKVSSITSAKYDTSLDFTANHIFTSETHASVGDANSAGAFWFDLTGHAGNHAFSVQWSGGGTLYLKAMCGSGDLHASILDLTATEQSEVVPSPTGGPTAATPVTNKAFPVWVSYNQGFDSGGSGTITCSSGCTRTGGTPISGGYAMAYGPVSTPAGTPTAAVFAAGAEYYNFITLVFKPAGAGGGGPPAFLKGIINSPLRGGGR